jgi:hypothetical protein
MHGSIFSEIHFKGKQQTNTYCQISTSRSKTNNKYLSLETIYEFNVKYERHEHMD